MTDTVVKISDLLFKDFPNIVTQLLAYDPLAEEDGFEGVKILGIWDFLIGHTVMFLLDLRTSEFDVFSPDCNTGALVLRKTTHFSISHPNVSSFHPLHVWHIGLSKFDVNEISYKFHVRNIAFPSEIIVEALAADLVLGYVEGIGGIGTSIDEGIEDYLETTANWQSQMKIINLSRFPRRKLD
jgi:hypothetical protein